MNIIDTHTHLYSDEFNEDRDEVIQRAISAGVTKFFLPSIDSSQTQAMYDLEKQYPESMFLMTGLHPTYVKENYLDELAHVEAQLQQRTFYAIGEIGIDLYWDKTFLNEQIHAFKTQIKLAKRYDLPIVIHCREAFDEVFQVLEEESYEKLRGIFHCFTGDYTQALRAISYNMKLGIGGVVTYKNGKIDQFLKKISITDIVLETDAPYLSPVPFRGKRNESSYLLPILDKLASVYELSAAEVANITTTNSIQIFGI